MQGQSVKTRKNLWTAVPRLRVSWAWPMVRDTPSMDCQLASGAPSRCPRARAPISRSWRKGSRAYPFPGVASARAGAAALVQQMFGNIVRMVPDGQYRLAQLIDRHAKVIHPASDRGFVVKVYTVEFVVFHLHAGLVIE